jgi:hypothetical protein
MDLRYIVRQAADLDLSYTRHHLRRPDRYQQFVRPSLALEENVRTTHVRY